MSNKRIIFQNDDGGVSVIIPSDEAETKFGLDAIAKKDVPALLKFFGTGTFDVDALTGESYEVGEWRLVGRPYKIIDVSDLPTDRVLRDAWEVDVLTLTDGISSINNTFE